MQKAISFNGIAIVYVKVSAYKIHFWYISKNNAISIMYSNLIDQMEISQFFLLYIKNEITQPIIKETET